MKVSSGACLDGQFLLEGQRQIQMGKGGNQRDLINTILHSNMGLGDPARVPASSSFVLLPLTPLSSALFGS